MKSAPQVLLLSSAMCTAVLQAQHPTQPKAEDLVRSATAAQQRGDFKTAIADFQHALAIRPDMAEAQVGLGAALVAAGDLDNAIVVDTRALEKSPDNLALRTNLGLAYYRKGDLAHARYYFEAVHAAHPEDVHAAVLLSYAYNKLGREAETVVLLAPFETAHESDLDLKYALGFAMLQTGRQAEGIKRIEKVAEARKQADAWLLAGTARFQLRQFQQALNDAQQGLQANASFPGLRTLAGQTQYALGNLEAAATEFQAALRQDPNDFTANLYLGILRFDEHDLDSAQPLLELALSIHPQDPLTRLEVARLRNLKGDPQGALDMLLSLEQSDPEWLDPHIELAAVYYKLHRSEDGQREREQVKKLEALREKPREPK